MQQKVNQIINDIKGKLQEYTENKTIRLFKENCYIKESLLPLRIDHLNTQKAYTEYACSLDRKIRYGSLKEVLNNKPIKVVKKNDLIVLRVENQDNNPNVIFSFKLNRYISV